MNRLMDKLGERRRDSIWCFILGLLSFGYGWSIVGGGQFLIDNNAPLIIMAATIVTVSLLGALFGVAGVVLVIYGLLVLFMGGMND